MLDAFVTTVVLDRLGRAEVDFDDGPDTEVLSARAQVVELRRRLDDAATEYVVGNLSAQMLARVETELVVNIADAERRTRQSGLPTTVGDLASGDVVWDGLTVEQRREVIHALVSVRVDRSRRPCGSRGFDPHAVRLEWRR